MEKQATESTRKASGDLLIQISTHQGTRCPGERLDTQSDILLKTYHQLPTYYIACFQVTPSKLFTAAPMLNTSEMNQNEFTASASGLPTMSKENCMVVAVTAEKNVATVLRLRRF